MFASIVAAVAFWALWLPSASSFKQCTLPIRVVNKNKRAFSENQAFPLPIKTCIVLNKAQSGIEETAGHSSPSLDLSSLNKEQYGAVTADLVGATRVLAGPGSGKTRVLTYRIAYMLEQGVKPWSVLAVTFTNKAAQEMRGRLAALVGGEEAAGAVTAGTFHAVCARVLREFGDLLPAPLSGRFTILDTADVRSMISKYLKDLNIDHHKYKPATIASLISRRKSSRLSAREALAGEVDDLEMAGWGTILEQVCRLYEEELLRNNAMDFDDLLLRTLELLRTEDAALAKLRRRWRQILVDEWQDTNSIQYDLVRLLALGNPNPGGGQGKPPVAGEGESQDEESRWPRGLFVVGDADQSIYGWRGADWANVQRLEEEPWGGGLRKFVLEANYRSTPNIVAAAQALIGEAPDRPEKGMAAVRGAGAPVQLMAYEDDREEARNVARAARALARNDRVPPSEIGILYRTNSQSRSFEQVLVEQGMPYVVIGAQRFYERKEIKDLLLYLKLLNNPQDRLNFEKVVTTPRRGVGTTCLSKFEEWYQEGNEDGTISCVTKVLALLPEEVLKEKLASAPPKALNWPGVDFNYAASANPEAGLDAAAARRLRPLAAFAALALDLWLAAHARDVEGVLREVMERVDFADHLGKISKDALEAEDRAANVEEMCAAARRFGGGGGGGGRGTAAAADGGLAEYLEEVALISGNEDEEAKDANKAVRLMTVHAAKGLEFEAVFLVGMEEGTFPLVRRGSIKDLEEERRLAYVGVTRAKSYLQLSFRKVKDTYFQSRYTASGKKTEKTSQVRNEPSRFLRALDPSIEELLATKELAEEDSPKPSYSAKKRTGSTKRKELLRDLSQNYEVQSNAGGYVRERITKERIEKEENEEYGLQMAAVQEERARRRGSSLDGRPFNVEKQVAAAQNKKKLEEIQRTLHQGGRLRVSTAALLSAPDAPPPPPAAPARPGGKGGGGAAAAAPKKRGRPPRGAAAAAAEGEGDLPASLGDLTAHLGYTPGRDVEHAAFGMGKIIVAEGDPAGGMSSLRLKVDFDGMLVSVPLMGVQLR